VPLLVMKFLFVGISVRAQPFVERTNDEMEHLLGSGLFTAIE
jgi:hypothetical protein